MAAPSAAIVLAGGHGRRLAGTDKPALKVDGRRLLDTALAALPDARVVVVGPDRPIPAGVILASEFPPGGGPAAGLAAGLAALRPEPDEWVAVLAADLPGITAEVMNRLTELAIRGDRAGALALDQNGRRQLLVGVWNAGRLVQAVGARSSWHGKRLADLLDPLDPAAMVSTADEVADIDTDEDLQHWQQRGRPGAQTS